MSTVKSLMLSLQQQELGKLSELLLRYLFYGPELRFSFVNVVDILKLASLTVDARGLSDEEFDKSSPADRNQFCLCIPYL